MKRKYRHAEAALICGAFASLFYGCLGVEALWGNSINEPIRYLMRILLFFAPAFFLMAPGVYLRFSWLRLIILTLYSFLLNIFTFHLPSLYSCQESWPNFRLEGSLTLGAAVFCVYFGVVCMSFIPGKWWIKLLSPIVSGIIILAAANFLRTKFPEQRYVLLQIWEYIAIIISGPGLCVLAWIPFDFVTIKENVDENTPLI